MRNQFRWAVRIVLAGVMGVAGSAYAADDSARRPRVAIVDFDATPGGWTLPPPQLGATVAQLLLDKLVGVAPFHIFDGRFLSYGGSPSDRHEPIQALRENARRAGVEYLIVGSITRFSNEQRRRTAGGGGFRVPVVGGYRRESNEMAVSILASVVDVRSGEVVATVTGQGHGTRRKIGLGALGFLRAAGGAAVSSGSSSSRDAQLDEAINAAVSSAAQALVNAAPRVEQARAQQNE
jgi:hypothetical protein